MKKTVKLYAARAGSGSAYIYNEKLIPQGNRGVHTEYGGYPTSGDMVIAKGLFELMGIPFPEGATFELDITVTEPRKKGWYAVRLADKDTQKRVLYWDGDALQSGYNAGATWRPYEVSWVADEPIPDPFERYHDT